MSTSFIHFLDDLDHYISFLFLKKRKKIEDSSLKNQAVVQSYQHPFLQKPWFHCMIGKEYFKQGHEKEYFGYTSRV